MLRLGILIGLACASVPPVSAAAPFAQLSSTETQMGGAAKVVTFNACDGASGVSSLGGAIGFPEPGSYFVTAAGQVGGTGTGTVKLWLRLNGKDVDNSNTEQAVVAGSTSVVVSQGVVEVKAGDKLTLIFSSTARDIGLVATRAKKEPAIPSMIFSTFRVNAAAFAQLSSPKTQSSPAAAAAVALEQTDAAKGIANRKGEFSFAEDGVYYVIAAGQVGGTGTGTVRLALTLNGKELENTSAEQSVVRGSTSVLVTQRVAGLKAGDAMALTQSGRGEGVALVASRPRGEPAVPSAIVTAFRTGPTFAQLSSVRTQAARDTGTPVALERSDSLGNATNADGVVTVKTAGTYFVIGAGQVGGEGAGTVKLWLRQNGKDVENSNTEQSCSGGSTAVTVTQGVMELEAGDTIQLVQSVKGKGLGLVATPKGAAPAVPSVILSMFRIE